AAREQALEGPHAGTVVAGVQRGRGGARGRQRECDEGGEEDAHIPRFGARARGSPKAAAIARPRGREPVAGAAAWLQAARAGLGASAPATLARWRSGEIRTTFQASPTRSIAPMTSAEMSTSHQRSPCFAERGNAWWLWCQDSPNEG